MPTEDEVMDTYRGVKAPAGPWETYEWPFRYKRPWGEFPLNWGGGFPSVGLDFGGTQFGGALTGGESGFDAGIPTQLGAGDVSGLTGGDVSGLTGGGFSNFLGSDFTGDLGEGFAAGSTQGGVGAPFTAGGLFGAMFPGAVQGYFSGAPFGKGFEGGILGATSNLGGLFGGKFGQAITNALGLTTAPPNTYALSGLLGDKWGPTAQGVLSTVANIASKGSPVTTMGIPALNAILSAFQGKNIARDVSNVMLFGLPKTLGQIPVLGNFIRGTISDPLASAINALGESLGLTSQPSPFATAPGTSLFGGIPGFAQVSTADLPVTMPGLDVDMPQVDWSNYVVPSPIPAPTPGGGDLGGLSPFANYGEGPAVPGFGLGQPGFEGNNWGYFGGWGAGPGGPAGGYGDGGAAGGGGGPGGAAGGGAASGSGWGWGWW